MKSLNNKGFMLVETLIVTTIVASFVIFMYSEVHTIINNFNRNINYNTSNATYAAGNIRKLIYNNNVLDSLTSTLGTNVYTKITTSSFSNVDYATALYNALDIKNVIMAKNDVSALKKLNYSHNFTLDLQSFIKSLKQEDLTSAYLLIVELDTGEYASMIISNNLKNNYVTISGTDTLSVTVGSNAVYTSGLTATTSKSEDVSNMITCTGDVDLNKAGTYKVNCFVNNNELFSDIFVRKIEVQ